jgi:hypothetical protein
MAAAWASVGAAPATVRRDAQLGAVRGHESGGHERAHAVPVRREATHVHVAQSGEDRDRRVGANDVGGARSLIGARPRRAEGHPGGVGVVRADRDEAPPAHLLPQAEGVLMGVAAAPVEVDGHLVDGAAAGPCRAGRRLGIARDGHVDRRRLRRRRRGRRCRRGSRGWGGRVAAARGRSDERCQERRHRARAKPGPHHGPLDSRAALAVAPG